jgi:DNA-binding transcriptional LysR family regulator
MRLESQAGVPLLHRTTRRLSLTAEGQILYSGAVQALESLSDADAALQSGAASLSGSIRLALPPALATRDLLRRLHALTASNTSLSLQLVVTNVAVELVAGGFDAGVRVGPQPDSALVMRTRGEVAWPLCASPAYIATMGTPAQPDDLAEHECLRLLTARGQDAWTLTNADGATVHARTGGRIECDDSRVLGDAVYAGLGIGVRSPRELARGLDEGTLAHVLPQWRMAGGRVSVLLPAGRSRLPRLAALVDVLREAVSEVLWA